MPAFGPFAGNHLGPSLQTLVISPSAIDLKAANAWAALRFRAVSTDDVTSVSLYWGTVTAGTSTTVEIWTIDATTGKPSAIYDASATVTQNATTGAQTYTFASAPTAGLTAGAEYAVVVKNAAGAVAALPLNGGATWTTVAVVGNLSSSVLTSADAGTAWAETTSVFSLFALGYEGGAAHDVGVAASYAVSAHALYGTNWGGAKFTLDTRIDVAGIWAIVSRVGTPAGDLRLQVVQDSNTAITNAAVTVDKDSILTQLAAFGQRMVRVMFPAVVTLNAGNYRVALDSASSADSSNCWRFGYTSVLGSAQASEFLSGSSSNSGASWSDGTTPGLVGVILWDIPAVSGGAGGGSIFGSGVVR